MGYVGLAGIKVSREALSEKLVLHDYERRLCLVSKVPHLKACGSESSVSLEGVRGLGWFVVRIGWGDDGSMAGSVRYAPELRERVVRLLSESRASYSSEIQAIVSVAVGLGVSVESPRRGGTTRAT